MVSSDRRIQENIQQGIKLLGEENFDEAVECFNKVLEIEPEHGEALFWMAKTYEAKTKHLETQRRERLKKISSVRHPSDSYDLDWEITNAHGVTINYYEEAFRFAPNPEEVFSDFANFMATPISNLTAWGAGSFPIIDLAVENDIGEATDWYRIGEAIYRAAPWERYYSDYSSVLKCFNMVIDKIRKDYELKSVNLFSDKDIQILNNPDVLTEEDKYCYANALLFLSSAMFEKDQYDTYFEFIWELNNILEDATVLVKQLLEDIGKLVEENTEESVQVIEPDTASEEEIGPTNSLERNEEHERWVKQNECITQFKSRFKNFIISKLKKWYGEDYWMDGVPEKIRKKAENRAEQDNAKHPNRPKISPYDELTVRNFADLVEYKPNWNEIFKPIFHTKKWITKRLHKIADYRNDIKHEKGILSENEVKKLEGFIGEIFECVDKNTA